MKPQIRTITEPREKLKAELEEIEAGNQRTRDEIERLQEVLKGGLEAASEIKDQLEPTKDATQGEKLEVSKADREAYANLPEGWFEWFDASGVRCPQFRLGRLVERGMVEDRIEGKWPDITKLYRKCRRNSEDEDDQ